MIRQLTKTEIENAVLLWLRTVEQTVVAKERVNFNWLPGGLQIETVDPFEQTPTFTPTSQSERVPLVTDSLTHLMSMVSTGESRTEKLQIEVIFNGGSPVCWEFATETFTRWIRSYAVKHLRSITCLSVNGKNNFYRYDADDLIRWMQNVGPKTKEL